MRRNQDHQRRFTVCSSSLPACWNDDERVQGPDKDPSSQKSKLFLQYPFHIVEHLRDDSFEDTFSKAKGISRQ